MFKTKKIESLKIIHVRKKKKKQNFHNLCCRTFVYRTLGVHRKLCVKKTESLTQQTTKCRFSVIPKTVATMFAQK